MESPISSNKARAILEWLLAHPDLVLKILDLNEQVLPHLGEAEQQELLALRRNVDIAAWRAILEVLRDQQETTHGPDLPGLADPTDLRPPDPGD